jgi:ligand-binding sensor domain-containing protein
MTKCGRGLSLLVVLGVLEAHAGVGTWKNFTSMKDVRDAARQGTTCWAATSGGLFGWTEGGSTYRQFTSAEGLQSMDLTAVAVDAGGQIWSGTSSGIIQILTPATNTVRIVLDIAENQNQPNKRINSLAVAGDTILICTDFGLSVYRTSRSEFGDTYTRFGAVYINTRFAVASAAIYNGSLWASISDGQLTNAIAAASLSNPNLQQPDAWTLHVVGGPAVVPHHLAVFRHRLYAGTSSGLYYYDGTSWTAVPDFAGQQVLALSAGSSNLLVCTNSFTVSTIDSLFAVARVGPALPLLPTSVMTGSNGRPVVGTPGAGLMTADTAWVSHFPNGPNSNQFLNVAVDLDGTVWCASGYSNGTGLYRFNGRDWKSFTVQNSVLPWNDVYRVSVGCNGSLWASTYGRGVVEFLRGSDNLDTAHVYGRNVGMIGIPVDPSYIVVSNVICDSRGKTWMSVIDPVDKNALVVRRADGTWTSFPVLLSPTSGTKITLLMENVVDRSLAVDAFDNIWAIVRDPAYRGVMTLGNGGQLQGTIATLVTTNDGLPSNEIKTLIIDRDNAVWVGTDKGIGIISDPSRPSSVAAYQPLFGLVINTIAVDALNQKWVGTSEGVVVLSSDGTETLATYTVENTAGTLIDNDVKSIAVDPASGTVYFGTTSGLASLTTAATQARQDFNGLTIYPNPYRIPAGAPLTVDGLVENSTLKILTVDGRLVREVKTPGGRIGFWDGKDTEGKDVASGVYLIVAYSEDGGKVATGKVAVLKK